MAHDSIWATVSLHIFFIIWSVFILKWGYRVNHENASATRKTTNRENVFSNFHGLLCSEGAAAGIHIHVLIYLRLKHVMPQSDCGGIRQRKYVFLTFQDGACQCGNESTILSILRHYWTGTIIVRALYGHSNCSQSTGWFIVPSIEETMNHFILVSSQ